MSEFDAVDYFNRRAADTAAKDLVNPPQQKALEIESSLVRARDALIDSGIRKREALERNKGSWVGKLGLEPDGAAAQAVNLGASAYSGASRVAGDITGFLAADLDAMLRDATISETEVGAINRYRQGVASEEDVDIITARRTAGAHSPLDMATRADQARERSANIDAAFDRSSVVDTTRRDELSQQLGAEFGDSWGQVKTGAKALWDGDLAGSKDLATGMAKLIFNAGEAAVSNPGAAAEYIAENIPQLAIGAFGTAGKAALLTSNAGYASENYQQGIAKYQAENGGAYPPAEERQRMAILAASLVAAEQVVDTSLLKGMTGAAKAVEDTAKTGLVQSLKNTAKVGATGLATESVTEGYQTFAEGEVNGTPATAKEIYEGAVIGGLAGGGMAAGGRGVGEVLKATPEHLEERQRDLTRKEAQEAAIATGDVSALVDPKSAVYSPAQAITALAGNSELPTSTPETKQANLTQANAIVADLEAQKAKTETDIAAIHPDGVEGLQGALAQAKAERSREKVMLLTEMLADEASLRKQGTKLDRQLEQAREAMTRFHQDAQPGVTELDVAAEAEVVNTSVVPEIRSQAADRIINLSMAIPERLDAEMATSLAENADNGLTAAQRTYFREFSAARQAENKLKDTEGVAQEIYAGGKGYVGLVQYRARVAQALSAGNKAQADQHLADLSKFAADHGSKAAAAAAAWGQGPGNQIMRVKNGPWMVLETRRPYAEVTRNGGLTLNAQPLVDAMKTESDAINQTVSELAAAYALKFPTAKSPGVNDVPNVPEAPAVSEAAGNEPQAAQAVGRDATSEAAGGVPAAGARRADVGAARVKEAESVQKTEPTEADSQASPDAAVTAVRNKGEQQSNESSVADAQVATQQESAEQTQEAASGKLAALGEQSPEGAGYNQRKLIADYFTQTVTREGDATERPLVKVQNFLSQGWENVLSFVQFTELSEDQINLLRVFREKAVSWGETLQKNLARRQPEFFYTDLMQFFVVEDDKGGLDLEENLKTAMSYAAFSWVAENATRSPANTDEEINRILGREEDHRVEEHERAKLLYAGARENVVKNALGQRAVQALGLKATKDAPLNIGPQLESSMGAHIFKMMMDQGLLERTTISAQDMAAMMGQAAPQEQAAHYFLKLTRDTDRKLSPKAQEAFTATMGTQGLLDKLFSVEPGMKEPSHEPVPFTQATTRNTDQAVPSKLKEIVEKENAGASFVRQDVYNLFVGLQRDIILQIAGAKTVDPTETHVVNRPSNEAKNDGLARELDNILGFVEGMLDREGGLELPLYFDHSVWKQQRVGIATNVVNPQTSKIHRHMLFRKTWETTVARNDPAQMENYQLRVAEGLGIKTDKQSNERSIEAFNKKVASPVIQAAVAVLQKRLNDVNTDLSGPDQDALLLGVQAGGENMHSLDALMALAHEANAKESGAVDFKVQMMGEVDGVTNGPMLSHLLMGAANSVEDLFGLLNRGGFFEQGNEHIQYNLWREAAGHFDLYEVTAGHMTEAVQSLVRDGITNPRGKVIMPPWRVGQVMGVIYGFTGTLAENGKVTKDGRNIIKTPLTAMVFGSSVGSAVDSMANKFVESIYAGIEDTAKGLSDAMSREQLIGNINQLLSEARAPMLSPKLTVVQLMEIQFSEEQVKGLKDTFTKTVGAAVRTTMETDFASYIAQRSQFNLAAQTTFELFNAVYTGLRDTMVAELVKSGEIAVNPKTKEPLHDLTAAQEATLQKRLAKMAPVLHTAMSKDSGSLRAGLHISKSGRKLTESKKVSVDGRTVTRRSPYEGDAKFATPFADNNSKSSQTRAYEQTQTSPGVAMMPMSAHSADSAVMHSSIGDTEVLNVHDAKGVGLAGFQQAAESLNQSTWNVMLSYSPASEMFEALSRTVVGLAGLIEEGNLPPVALENLSKAIANLAGKKEMDPETFLADVVEGMKASAFKADDMKLQALAIMESIDQYALQGGNYQVTDKDRAEAAALRASLSNVVPSPVAAAVEAIAAGVKASTAEKVEPLLEEDPPKPKTSPFGELGGSTQGDPDLLAFFSKTPKASARQVMELLHRKLNSSTDGNRDFNMKLLRVLAKTVNPDLQITLITADTSDGDVIGKPDTPSLGWFSSVGGQDAIYVAGPDFAHSNLVPELLLHELTHAATAYRLTTTAGKPFRAELEQLLQEVRTFVKKEGLTKFDAAVVSVDELVAYGMTSKAFQTEVLAKVAMKPSAGGLSTAMKTFVDVLARLLGFKDAAEANGLGVLLTNVAGLFEQESNERKELKLPTITLSMTTDPLGTVRTFSTLDIHGALNAGDVTPEFDVSLRGLLGGIVQKLHGPFGAFKEALMANQALTPLDVWQKALATGVAPFAASVQASPLKVSEREAFVMEQIEATMRDVLSRNETTSKSAYKELAKLYLEMRDTVKPSDFASQAEYDFIFKVTPGADGRSEHLARFAAFGLAHQEVNKLLQVGTRVAPARTTAGKSFAERLQIVWEHVLEFFVGEITKTYQGQLADDKLNSLVSQLVDIEAKKRTTIARRAVGLNPMASVERGIKNVGEGIRSGVTKAATSDFVGKSRSGVVRGIGGLVGVVANDRVDGLLKHIVEVRDRSLKSKHGLAMGLLTDARGPGKVLNLLALASTNMQRLRKTLITDTGRIALDSFINGGEDLGKEGKASITQVFLRTGMHHLLGAFNMAELENLMGNKPAIDAEINKLTSQLTGFGKFAPHFIHQANALGYFKVTGRVKHAKMMMNAHNIARLYGTANAGQLTEAQSKQAEAVIEKLVPLYALSYADTSAVNAAKQILRTENARTDGKGNGVEFVLALHRKLEQESLGRLFRNQEALAMHGYTPEILNPHTDIKTANEFDGKSLVLQGYTKGAQVERDPTDPNTDVKFIYVLRDGGLAPHLTGVISYTGKNTKGAKQHSGYLNVNTSNGLSNAALNADIMHGKPNTLDVGPAPDLTKSKHTFMAPVVNPSGDIVNWRYLMQDSTKDAMLERDNRFEKVLGTLAGSIYDKESTTELNTKAITALKEIYTTEKATSKDSFVLVGPKSPDPELREIWSMLPDDTKAIARQVWGKDGMLVRKDQLVAMFGYRKYSLAEMFQKNPDARGHLEKIFVAVMENTLSIYARAKNPTMTHQEAEEFAKRAAVVVTKGERAWQALVHETKDILVVKTGVVMMGNIWSNLSLLVLSGVPFADVVKNHLVAYRGYRAYHSDSEKIAELQALLDTGLTRGEEARIRRDLAVHKDALVRNPVAELIDAGLMPTIVEDIAADDDIYSYKSEFARRTEKLVSKLNPTVVSVGKQIYMTHDTKIYQGLSRITQLSDFVARYTLYQHVTNRKDNPLSKEDAIHEASETFINYDTPMHQGMQYLDDMGITMFTKYFLRIQRVLLKLSKENPARVLMGVGLDHFLDLGPIVLEGSFMTKIGNNPIGPGALNYPYMLDELATVSAGMSLIK